MVFQPPKSTHSPPTPPTFLAPWPLRGGEPRRLFNQPPVPPSCAHGLSLDAPGAKMSKDPRSFLLTFDVNALSDRFSHVAVHLRLLRPFRHPPHVPQALLLALAGKHYRGRNFDPTDFHHRIRILCWCTTSTSPTRTTTRCWSPTPCPCGARKRSGPRRNSSPS